MTAPRIAVIGAGWSGAVAARRLHDAGIAVEVFEQTTVVGDHSHAADSIVADLSRSRRLPRSRQS